MGEPAKVQADIDVTCASLWGISELELAAMRVWVTGRAGRRDGGLAAS